MKLYYWIIVCILYSSHLVQGCQLNVGLSLSSWGPQWIPNRGIHTLTFIGTGWDSISSIQVDTLTFTNIIADECYTSITVDIDASGFTMDTELYYRTMTITLTDGLQTSLNVFSYNDYTVSLSVNEFRRWNAPLLRFKASHPSPSPDRFYCIYQSSMNTTDSNTTAILAEFSDETSFTCLLPFLVDRQTLTMRLAFDAASSSSWSVVQQRQLGPDFTVYIKDPAPSVASAVFLDQAGVVNIRFNESMRLVDYTNGQEMNTFSTRPCVYYFDDNQQYILWRANEYQDCQAKFINDKEMILYSHYQVYANYPTTALSPTTKITLRNNVFYSRTNSFALSSSGKFSFSYGPFTNAVNSTSRIVMFAAWMQCSPLTLDISQMMNIYGRWPQQIIMSLVNPIPDVSFDRSRLSLLEGQSEVAIRDITDWMDSRDIYTFQFQFISPFEVFQPFSVSVFVPKVKTFPQFQLLVPPTHIKINQVTKVWAQLSPDCNFLDTEFVMEWKFIQSSDPSFRFDSVSKLPLLVIPRYTFSPSQSYIFQFTTSYKDLYQKSFNVTLTTLSTDVRIYAGGFRLVSFQHALVLEGTVYSHVPGAESEFLYTWSCKTEEGGTCIDVKTNRAIVLEEGRVIDVTKRLDGGYSYWFTLQTSPKSMAFTLTESTKITVIYPKIPTVQLLPSRLDINKDALFSIEARIQNTTLTLSSPLVYQWSLLSECNGNVYPSFDLLDSHLATPRLDRIQFQPNVLSSHTTYCLAVQVWEKGKEEAIGAASMELKVGGHPMNGMCSIDMTNAMELDSLVTIDCKGWTTDRKALPLTYQFYISSNNQDYFALSLPQISSRFSTVLPQGKQTLLVRIQDQSGGTQQEQVSFSIQMKQSNATFPLISNLTQTTLLRYRLTWDWIDWYKYASSTSQAIYQHQFYSLSLPWMDFMLTRIQQDQVFMDTPTFQLWIDILYRLVSPLNTIESSVPLLSHIYFKWKVAQDGDMISVTTLSRWIHLVQQCHQNATLQLMNDHYAVISHYLDAQVCFRNPLILSLPTSITYIASWKENSVYPRNTTACGLEWEYTRQALDTCWKWTCSYYNSTSFLPSNTTFQLNPYLSSIRFYTVSPQNITWIHPISPSFASQHGITSNEKTFLGRLVCSWSWGFPIEWQYNTTTCNMVSLNSSWVTCSCYFDRLPLYMGMAVIPLVKPAPLSPAAVDGVLIGIIIGSIVAAITGIYLFYLAISKRDVISSFFERWTKRLKPNTKVTPMDEPSSSNNTVQEKEKQTSNKESISTTASTLPSPTLTDPIETSILTTQPLISAPDFQVYTLPETQTATTRKQTRKHKLNTSEAWPIKI